MCFPVCLLFGVNMICLSIRLISTDSSLFCNPFLSLTYLFDLFYTLTDDLNTHDSFFKYHLNTMN